jgi:hypothetical protein
MMPFAKVDLFTRNAFSALKAGVRFGARSSRKGVSAAGDGASAGEDGRARSG